MFKGFSSSAGKQRCVCKRSMPRIFSPRSLICIISPLHAGKTVNSTSLSLGEDIATCRGMAGVLKKLNSKGEWKDRMFKLHNQLFLGYMLKKGKETGEIKEYIDLMDTVRIELESGVLKLLMSSGSIYEFKGQYLELWEDALVARKEWALAHFNKEAVNDVASVPLMQSSPQTPGKASAPPMSSSTSPGQRKGNLVRKSLSFTLKLGRESEDKSVVAVKEQASEASVEDAVANSVHIEGYLQKKSHNKMQGYQVHLQCLLFTTFSTTLWTVQANLEYATTG